MIFQILSGRTVAFFAVVALIIASPAACAVGAADASILQGKADILAYHKDGLPDPVVIYAYDSKGDLLRVFGADGKNGFSDMKRMRSEIASGKIKAAVDRSTDIDVNFRRFLADQNLNIDNLIRGSMPYHLILVVPDTAGAPCPPCENYRAMLADATSQPASKNKFSLYTLKLGSSGVKFRTVK